MRTDHWVGRVSTGSMGQGNVFTGVCHSALGGNGLTLGGRGSAFWARAGGLPYDGVCLLGGGGHIRQEGIPVPVGCVPTVARGIRCPGLGTHPRHTQPRKGTLYQRYPPPRKEPGPEIPPHPLTDKDLWKHYLPAKNVLFLFLPKITSVDFICKQVCIPVWCVPLAGLPSVFWKGGCILPVGVHPLDAPSLDALSLMQPPPPPPRIQLRRLWKHYLPATLFAGFNEAFQ